MNVLKGFQQLTLSIVNLVNAPRNIGARTREAYAPSEVRKSLVLGAQLAVDHNLTIGGISEFSMRLPGDKVIITPGHKWLPTLHEDDILYGNLSGDWPDGNEESPKYLNWHLTIYRAVDAQAVAFCHPTSAMAFMNLGEPLDPNYLKDGDKAAGGLVILPSGIGIPEIEHNSTNHGVMMIPGSGVLAWGHDLQTAISRVEATNQWCRIALDVRSAQD